MLCCRPCLHARVAVCALQVTIGSEDLKANHMIQQVFQFPSELDKYRSLVKLLEQEMDGSRLLVPTVLLCHQ